jgi:hypothetical protein
MSADRFARAAKANDSGSWNKYSYTRGDPVNRGDRTGRFDCPPDSDTSVCVSDVAGGGDEPGLGYCDVNPSDLSCGGTGSGATADSTSPGPTGKFNQGNKTKLNSVAGARPVLVSEINNLSANCQKALPEKATLLSDAKDLKFLDARTSAGLAADLGGNNAIDLWLDPSNPSLGLSPNIVVGQKFFGFDPGRQGLTLLHELLHYATQLDDRQFDISHSIVPQVGQSWSAALTDWLSNDCPQK